MPHLILIIDGAFSFIFEDAMLQNIDVEIRETEQELKHIGSCTTKGLTDQEIAQLDERSFGRSKTEKIDCSTQ